MTADEICKKIADSLEEADTFSYEMEILHGLHTAPGSRGVQMRLRHGATYVDPFEEKRRQFDIRAEISRGGDNLLLAVECKKLHESSPVIVSEVPRTSQESYHCLIKGPVSGGQSKHVLRNKSTSQIYPEGRSVGKSVFCLPLNSNSQKPLLFIKESQVYERYSQSLASLEDMILQENNKLLTTPNGMRLAGMAILVVPEGCLWTVPYDSRGTRTSNPRRVDHANLFISREIDRLGCSDIFVVTHLDIMTTVGFTKFTQELLCERSELWEDIFPCEDDLKRKRGLTS